MAVPSKARRPTTAAQGRVREGPGQAAEGLVGGDGDVVLRLEFGRDLEQQLGSVAVRFHGTEFTGAEQVGAAIPGRRPPRSVNVRRGRLPCVHQAREQARHEHTSRRMRWKSPTCRTCRCGSPPASPLLFPAPSPTAPRPTGQGPGSGPHASSAIAHQLVRPGPGPDRHRRTGRPGRNRWRCLFSSAGDRRLIRARGGTPPARRPRPASPARGRTADRASRAVRPPAAPARRPSAPGRSAGRSAPAGSRPA